MEKMLLEKLTEVSNILFVAHQKIEHMQKMLILNLKKTGKLHQTLCKEKIDDKNKHL